MCINQRPKGAMQTCGAEKMKIFEAVACSRVARVFALRLHGAFAAVLDEGRPAHTSTAPAHAQTRRHLVVGVLSTLAMLARELNLGVHNSL